MLLTIVSKMSRDNFNKINVVAKRTCKYFFVHILLKNQSIFIHHKQFNFRYNTITQFVETLYYFTKIVCRILKLIFEILILFFEFRNNCIIEMHQEIDSNFSSFSFFRHDFDVQIFTNDRIFVVVFVLK